MLSLRQIMNFDSVTNFRIARPDIEIPDNMQPENNITAMYERGLIHATCNLKAGNILSAALSMHLSKPGKKISPQLNFNASLGTGTSGLAKDVLQVNYTGEYQTIGVTKSGDFVYSPLTDVVTRTTPFDVQFKNNLNKEPWFFFKYSSL